jgi:hypothetical protein
MHTVKLVQIFDRLAKDACREYFLNAIGPAA